MTDQVQSGALSGVYRIRPAYAQVAAQLRKIILSGEMATGERLPNEATLAQQFGVSRTTVREALRVLSSQGLLVTERGVTGGTFVSKADPQQVSELLEIGLSVMTGSEGLTIAELLEAREVIEGPAARLAALHRTEADLQQLERLSEDGHPDHASLDELFRSHVDFHLAVATASHNRLLVVVIAPIFNVLESFATQARASLNNVSHDHSAIVAAIRGRKAAKAEMLMLEHLAQLRHLYVDTRATDAASGR